MMKLTSSRGFVGLFLMLMPVLGLALEFKSVATPKAILYDAPSQSATKVFLLSQFYPVEVIVNLGAWLKVRDAEGGLYWIESKNLSAKRTVIVTASEISMHQEAVATSPLIANVAQQVILELLELTPNNGWLKVKHIDGAIGFIPFSAVWGL